MIISGNSVTESSSFVTTVLFIVFGFGFGLIFFDASTISLVEEQVWYCEANGGFFLLQLDVLLRRKRSIEYVSCHSKSQTSSQFALRSIHLWLLSRHFHTKKLVSIRISVYHCSMNRREHDRDRRPPKRSRSPDEREPSQRDDKRRRPPANERRPERSRSPRGTRSSTTQNGRDDRRSRRDERRDRDSRSRKQGTPYNDYLTRLDEQNRYDRDRKPPSNSQAEPDTTTTNDRKPPPPKPSTKIEPPAKPKPITSATLLEEEEDLPISKLMGFSRFSTTKGQKHEDYGAVDLIKKRTYRQYMNRPGGFNRPLD